MTPTHPHRCVLFISHSHTDDLPAPGESKGWVSTLVDYLELLLAKKLGREGGVSLWTDRDLGDDARLTPEVADSLRNGAAIVIILSPGYLASEWCRRGDHPWLRSVNDAGSRVFLVEHDRVEARPPELADLPSYRFWEEEPEGRGTRVLGFPRPDPDREPRYHQLIIRLSNDLAEAIRHRTASASRPRRTVATDDRVTVFLAEVTDDLDTERDEVKNYVVQAGLRVLPEVWYPRDPAAFREAAAADLVGSKLFVQLLSGAAGKRSPDLPRGYIGLQHALARERKIPVMQWRSRALDLTRIADPDHRALLEGQTVAAEGLEEFKGRVVRFVSAPPPLPKPQNQPGKDYVVFVNVEETDRPLVDEIRQVLDTRSIGYSLPLRSDQPSEVHEDLEQNLLYCDAQMLIYGRTRPTWLRRQLLESRKILYKREAPLLTGIYEGPPEPKVPLDLTLPNLRFINCRRGLDEGEVQRFLDALAGAPDPVVPLPKLPKIVPGRIRDQVFVSYSQADRRWLERLQMMLKPWVRSGALVLWDDTRIQPGAEWRVEIEKAVRSAKVAVLLVSPHFLASDFIANQELPPLLKAAQDEGATVLWVPVSHCLYLETEIAAYQAAHKPAQPLDALRPARRDKALVAICQKIKAAVERS